MKICFPSLRGNIKWIYQNINKEWVMLNRAPTSPQFHPPPPSFTPSTQFHPAHFNFHPVLSVTPAVLLEPKHRVYLGNCPKFRPKNSKLSVLTENWQTWYLWGADSKSGLKSLKFWPKINFWAISVRKSKKSPLCLKIGTHGISRMLVFIPTLVFWISNLKSIFRQIRVEKFRIVCFAWKLSERVPRGFWLLFRD